MIYKEISPRFKITGKGGNVAICNIIAFTMNQKQLQEFFELCNVFWNRTELKFNYNSTTKVLSNIDTGRAITIDGFSLTDADFTAFYNEEQKEYEKSTIWESELKVLIDLDRPKESYIGYNLVNKHTVLLIIYSNGEGVIMGDYNSGAKYSSKVVSGGMKTGQTREIVFNWMSSHPCYRMIAPEFYYNFDITMDWSFGGGALQGQTVTDQATFEAFLSNGWDALQEQQNNLSGINITDFRIDGNRIRCNLYANGTILTFSNSQIPIVNANKTGVITGLEKLFLNSSDVVNYRPQHVPTTLKEIHLLNTNGIFGGVFPSSMTLFNFNNNSILAQDVAEMEAWIDLQPVSNNNCLIDFSNGPYDPTFTPFYTKATAKGYNVIF